MEFAPFVEYVGQPDASYAVAHVSSHETAGLTAYGAEMTSQTWRGIPWRHNLTVVRPREVRQAAKALLIIAGGQNDGAADPYRAWQWAVLRDVAEQTGCVTAMVEQVPNQPLFEGLVEDEIIAFSFDQFLKGEGDDWPLLLPMVKSAVRAMDAVQHIARAQMGIELDGFVLTGASKRGWTTWLTGAADDRVIGIAPMVIDMLNLDTQMERQRRTYGRYSENIHDYTERSLPDRIARPGGAKLAEMIDPYTHRARLGVPKLVCLGTNDPFWTVDAATAYFHGLPGKKWLHYEANAGHDLGPPTLAALRAFVDAVVGDRELPGLSWSRDGAARLCVEWKGASGKAVLWSAQSANRDFRAAEWTRRPLAGKSAVEVNIEPPASGWAAFYVEVEFAPEHGTPYGLTTEIAVLPDTFPYLFAEANA